MGGEAPSSRSLYDLRNYFCNSWKGHQKSFSLWILWSAFPVDLVVPLAEVPVGVSPTPRLVRVVRLGML